VAEPTPARTYDEVESTKTMLDRTERRLGLKPKRLSGAHDEFLLAAIVQNLKTLALRTLGPLPAERHVSVA